MLEFFKQGGILMYPLAVCSVMALAIILERWYNLRHSKVIRSEIIQVIENIKGPEDLGLAYSICEKNPGPFSSIMLTALQMKNLPKNKLLVLYCWETWCSLATKAAIPLLEKGFKVKELYGGIAAWETMGYPVVKDKPMAQV